MKVGFSPKIFEKHSYVKFHLKILAVGIKLFHAEKRTDRYYEANIRFSQFCERAHKGYSYMMMKETHLGSQDSL